MNALRAGDVLVLDRRASVQFAARPIAVRLIRVHEDRPISMGADEGWSWLDVYELAPDGEAVERRSIFVNVNHVRCAPALRTSGAVDVGPQVARPRRGHVPRNAKSGPGPRDQLPGAGAASRSAPSG